MTKVSRNIIIGAVIAIVIAVIMLGTVAYIYTPHGIPKGAYFLCDENGVATKNGPEHAWRIGKKDADYLYLEYVILEQDDKIFVWWESEDKASVSKYEISYDSITEVLTVNMPSEMLIGSSEGEMVDYNFKML